MTTNTKMIISLNDKDRELLIKTHEMLMSTASLLSASKGEADMDNSEDYYLIQNLYSALCVIYNAM